MFLVVTCSLSCIPQGGSGEADYGCASRLLTLSYFSCQGPFGGAVSFVSAGHEFLGLVVLALLFRDSRLVEMVALWGALFFYPLYLIRRFSLGYVYFSIACVGFSAIAISVCF